MPKRLCMHTSKGKSGTVYLNAGSGFGRIYDSVTTEAATPYLSNFWRECEL